MAVRIEPSLANADRVAGLLDSQRSGGMGEAHGIIISYSSLIALELLLENEWTNWRRSFLA